MSRGSWPWEAPSIVFYVSRRLQELQILTWLSQAKKPGGSPLKPLRASSEVWIFGGLESLEAGSDECLEDRVPGRLHLSYSTCLGGPWELQIP